MADDPERPSLDEGSGPAAQDPAAASPQAVSPAEASRGAAEGTGAPAADAPAGIPVPEGLGPGLLELQLPVFEGPLDLLLHLVREHRLDIFDIPIAFVTEKYLEMLDRMRELNLDVAGEYLLMAATLAHIKSRMLLPRPELEEDEEGAEGEGGDPREELVRRLLAYQKYREAADTLGGQDILGRDVFSRDGSPEAVPLPEGEIGLKEVSVFKLIEALDEVFRRAKVEVTHDVLLERVTISERISEMVAILREKRAVTFLSLFEGVRARGQIIVTFLAILELARLGLARVRQEELGGDILVAGTDRLDETDLGDVQDDFR
jgi:segregation and condensation protein A